jgi:hypothetical protein
VVVNSGPVRHPEATLLVDTGIGEPYRIAFGHDLAVWQADA